MPSEIRITGAREHNLKDISVTLPRDKFVVVTGLSGSGKSSLAFDTLYAEGQRRYVESLSAYARQFLDQMQKPDVDSIEGLSPAISIEQKTTSRNPRSTIGTVTEIYDYMRLLWSRVGIPYSPATGMPISSQSPQQIVDQVLEDMQGCRIMVLAPIVRDRKGEHKQLFTDLERRGFQRVRINGVVQEFGDNPKIAKTKKSNIEVVVDRLRVQADRKQRLTESIETALTTAEGNLMIVDMDSNNERMFSEHFACPVSGFSIEQIEPRLFSFNNPSGACPQCRGIGVESQFDARLIVPNTQATLRGGAAVPWAKSGAVAPYYLQIFQALGQHFGFDVDTPFAELSEEHQAVIITGTKERVEFVFADGNRTYRTKKPFEGVLGNLKRRLKETSSNYMQEEIARFQTTLPCTKCNGERLRAEALAVQIDHATIAQVCRLSIAKAQEWFATLNDKLSTRERTIGAAILNEINERLGFLLNVGLAYLTLDRAAGTLSGGESQRIRLASQIGSGLTGVLYVLDEPSIGLHQRDNERLIATLIALRDKGNTVVVIEHDEEAIRRADHLLDIGPEAGVHGGEVVAQGTYKDIIAAPASITGDYLAGRRAIPIPAIRRTPKHHLQLRGVQHNNIDDLDVEFPLGVLGCVTGVSGSGKSSLVIATLQKILARDLMGAHEHPGSYKSLDGMEHLDKIIVIDQSPIGRTPRSNPATYTGTFTPMRDWFAGLPESKARGYSAGRFSFNVKGGRCESCQGDGVVRIEMHFLPDVYVPCEVCRGKRYNRDTLEIRWKDRSIADILDLTIEEGCDLFDSVPSVGNKLRTLAKVGLGYIKIGQSATTLSGGEAQRIKLSRELARTATSRTIYILDEPTTGLHFHDISRLMDILQSLVNQGNSVLVIEHNLDVIKCADWIIDLGPEGGTGGGQIIATGTPESIAENPKSHTGRFLNPVLKNSKVQQTVASNPDAPAKKKRAPRKTAASG